MKLLLFVLWLSSLYLGCVPSCRREDGSFRTYRNYRNHVTTTKAPRSALSLKQDNCESLHFENGDNLEEKFVHEKLLQCKVLTINNYDGYYTPFVSLPSETEADVTNHTVIIKVDSLYDVNVFLPPNLSVRIKKGHQYTWTYRGYATATTVQRPTLPPYHPDCDLAFISGQDVEEKFAHEALFKCKLLRIHTWNTCWISNVHLPDKNATDLIGHSVLVDVASQYPVKVFLPPDTNLTLKMNQQYIWTYIPYPIDATEDIPESTTQPTALKK